MSKLDFLISLEKIIQDRISNNVENSYTSGLINKGEIEICKKIGEEATEVIMASTSEDNSRVIHESADLIYHLLVLLGIKGISIQDVVLELEKRDSEN